MEFVKRERTMFQKEPSAFEGKFLNGETLG